MCCIMFFSFFVLFQPYLIIILSSATDSFDSARITPTELNGKNMN
jgi:hypothetical protein